MPIETDSAAKVVAENFFTHDKTGVRLRITECQDCASRWFPPVAICSQCAGANVVVIESGTTGVAYASTVVRVGPPGFPAPYVLSYVDIDGVRLLAHTEAPEALEPGSPVELAVGEIGNADGRPLMSYVVRPHRDGAKVSSEGDRS
ncbi:Zn-ribbon domain-containing OB-fold protein [Nocardia fluminea]|uniref:Zn-ribbon domain-containing OB-fold protein n=1 Tax=Nocardia fluminea TaxID=134984 RepID=UPI00342BCA55